MGTAPHDWLYEHQGGISSICVVDDHTFVVLTRAESDAMLRDVYRWDVKQWISRERPNLGRRWLERVRPWLTWAGVRLLGWTHWRP